MNRIESNIIRYKGYTIKIKKYECFDIITHSIYFQYKIYGIKKTYSNYKIVLENELDSTIDEFKKEIDEFIQIDFTNFGKLDLLAFKEKYKNNFKINKQLTELIKKSKFQYIDGFRY